MAYLHPAFAHSIVNLFHHMTEQRDNS